MSFATPVRIRVRSSKSSSSKETRTSATPSPSRREAATSRELTKPTRPAPRQGAGLVLPRRVLGWQPVVPIPPALQGAVNGGSTRPRWLPEARDGVSGPGLRSGGGFDGDVEAERLDLSQEAAGRGARRASQSGRARGGAAGALLRRCSRGFAD